MQKQKRNVWRKRKDRNFNRKIESMFNRCEEEEKKQKLNFLVIESKTEMQISIERIVKFR